MRNKQIVSNFFFGLFVLSLIPFWTGAALAGGVQVSIDSFNKVFLKDGLYHFETATTDEDGKPIKVYRAKTRRNSVSLYIENKSINKTVMTFFSVKNGEVTELNAGYLKKLFEVFAPGWTDGSAWVKDTLAEMHAKKQSKQKTSQGNVSVVIIYDASFGMVRVSAF